MNKILVPTDFSAPAKKALLFALDLALKTNAQLLVCHVYQRLSPFLGDSYETTEEPRRRAMGQMEDFLRVATSACYSAVPIEYLVREGNPLQRLSQLINQDQVSLVVMGTKGAHDRLGKIFGTITETLVKRSLCPVVAIPEKAPLHAIENMVYTSTLEHSEVPALGLLLQLKDLFKANLTVLHVKSEDQLDLVEDNLIQEQLREEFPQQEFRFETVAQEEVVKGILDYLRQHQTHLLAFTVLEHDFWEVLFQDSVTTHLLHRLEIPMLALPFHPSKRTLVQKLTHERFPLESQLV
ncbi:universal stress protein [Rufibacter sediminis]|uniref:Universal stress protein n=1 Tax=Rufibacter sediminis TaxID=2762756 RepID=A0ABR6VVD5_9BACT|nr:universal stress protein [Rufibacter sediminis]MBC3541157.1 universal stress protein [Rufibacter sediminis]